MDFGESILIGRLLKAKRGQEQRRLLREFIFNFYKHSDDTFASLSAQIVIKLFIFSLFFPNFFLRSTNDFDSLVATAAINLTKQ
jgi:hypothetical protein